MKNVKLFSSLFLGLILLLPSFAHAAVFTRDLSFGVTTTEVSSLQQFLTYQGVYTGPITATFGPLTQSALIAFQKQERITPAVGYFGPTTRKIANGILIAHPEWTTTLSNDNTYKNVDGNTVRSPSTSSNGLPAGATAKCRDGTYSFSLNHSGSCSRHGGVNNWLK